MKTMERFKAINVALALQGSQNKQKQLIQNWKVLQPSLTNNLLQILRTTKRQKIKIIKFNSTDLLTLLTLTLSLEAY